MAGEEYEIPVFSGRITRRSGTVVFVAAVVYIIFDRISRTSLTAVLFVLGIVVFLVLGTKMRRAFNRCVWTLGEGGIRQTIFGITEEISYGEIAEAMQTRKIKVTSTAFRIPKKRGFITFHYEVGNGSVQRRIMEAYRFLAKKAPGQLPKLSYKVIGEMDRSFYYRKERRSCSIIMIAASIAMGAVDGDSVAFGCICAALGLIVQYAVLENLFTAVYFGKKIEKKIQEHFAQYSNVKLRKVRVSYVMMMLVIFAAAGMNLVFLFI